MDLFLANVENFTENFALAGCALHSMDLLLGLDELDYNGINTPVGGDSSSTGGGRGLGDSSSGAGGGAARTGDVCMMEDSRVIKLKDHQALQLRVLHAVVLVLFWVLSLPFTS